MSGFLKEILKSKKAIATIAAVIVATAGKYGLGLDTESVMTIVGALSAYIVGQGIADHGKEAAKVTAEAANKF